MEHFDSFENLVNYWHTLPPLWETLKKANLPIYLYGMGDGAEKIHSAMVRFGIPLAGIFASDAYVRGHSFLGHKVLKLSQVEESESDGFIILLAFAAFTNELIEQIQSIAARHTLFAPDTPVAGENLFTRSFLDTSLEQFRQTFELLADDLSKKVLQDTVAFKLTGDIRYLFSCQSPEAEVTDSIISLSHMPYTMVDLGGYDGDTVRQWITATEGHFHHILTVEPDIKNCRRMQRKMENWDMSRVTCVHAAAHSHTGTLSFTVRGGRNSAIQGAGGLTGGKTVEIPAETVDHLLHGEPASLIKMDVEGNEAEALVGAQQTICRYLPPLMISAYHRSEDLFALPLLIEQLTAGKYRYYLRHHQYIPAWETNYYLVPFKKADNPMSKQEADI